MRRVSCVVDSRYDGKPLWQVASEQLNISRAIIRRAKAAPGGLLLDGCPSYTTAVVRTGQVVAVDVSGGVGACEGSVTPEDGPLDILYEDQDLLAVNKPWDQVVHPCPGHRDGTLGNFVLGYLRRSGDDCRTLHPIHRLDYGTSGVLLYAKNAYAHERVQAYLHGPIGYLRRSGDDCRTLHPIHRLDYGTSGVLLYAKNAYAHERVQAYLHGPISMDRGWGRTYVAWCVGSPIEDQGIVNLPITRLEQGGIRRAVCSGGQHSVTHYRVLERFDADLTFMELWLETGRTHQIRVHLSHIGFPLLGDILYGAPSSLIARPALHSSVLRCPQPVTGEVVEIRAPLPFDMASVGERCDFVHAL